MKALCGTILVAGVAIAAAAFGDSLGKIDATCLPFADGERVTFLGDSITHGGAYHAYLQLYWDLRHPGSGTRLMNCGVGGDTAGGGVKRWAWDSAPQRADRTFVMFGMNDVKLGLYGKGDADASTLALRKNRIDEYAANMAEIAALVRSAGQKLVVMTPTPYDEYGPNYKVPAAKGGNDIGLAACAAIVRRLARREGATVIELHRPLTEFVRRHGEYLFCNETDRVHPRDDGHLIIMAEMLKAMGESPDFAGADVDAAGREELALDYKPSGLPFPVSEAYRKAEAVYPLTDTINREMLTVRNLPSGRYRLVADGEELGVFDAVELLRGVNLAMLPTPCAKQALEAWDVACALREAQYKLRDFAQIEFRAESEGAKRDDFDGVCAAMEAKIARMRTENSQWTSAYEKMLAGYRANKPQEAKFREEEERCRNRLREIAASPASYTLTLVRAKQ